MFSRIIMAALMALPIALAAPSSLTERQTSFGQFGAPMDGQVQGCVGEYLHVDL